MSGMHPFVASITRHFNRLWRGKKACFVDTEALQLAQHCLCDDCRNHQRGRLPGLARHSFLGRGGGLIYRRASCYHQPLSMIGSKRLDRHFEKLCICKMQSDIRLSLEDTAQLCSWLGERDCAMVHERACYYRQTQAIHHG
jgi:hypothetical protein